MKIRRCIAIWIVSLGCVFTSGTVVAEPLSNALEYYRAGHFSLAIEEWKRELNQGNGDRLYQGQIWTYLSFAYQELSQWDLALSASRHSIENLRPQDSTPYAQALNAQGKLFLSLGNIQGAISSWKTAERIYRQTNDTLGVQGSLVNQAIAYEQSGFYRRACLSLMTAIESTNRCKYTVEGWPQVLAEFRQLITPQLEVIALNTLSQIMIEMGDLEAAQATFTYQRKQYGLSSLDHQFIAANLARAQYRKLQQDYQRMRSQRRRQIIDIRLQEAFIQTKRTYSKLITNLPPQRRELYYSAQIDYLDFLIDSSASQQDELLEEIETVLAKTKSPQDNQQRIVYMAKIKHAEAMMKLQQMFGHALNLESSPEFLLKSLLSSSDSESTPERQAFAAGALGYYYEQQRQWIQAEHYTIQALQASPTPDYTYRWQWQLGRILIAQGRKAEATQAYQRAIQSLDSVRQNLTVLQRNAQFSFRDEIEPSYRQLASILLAETSPSELRLQQARQVIDQLQVTEVEDFLLQNCINASLASLDSFIAQKAQNSALIYTIIQDHSLDVIVKAGDQIAFHRTEISRQELQETLKAYRLILQEKLPSAKRASQNYGQALYLWMISPFQEELTGIDSLIFVLDGELRDIPMATLHNGQQYLIEQFSVAVTPGLQVLDINEVKNETESILVAGASKGDRQLGLPPLPAVERELEQIENLVPNSTVLINEAFSESTLQSALKRKDASIIHLATHGQFSSTPEDTFIATGKGERLNIDELGQLLRQKTQVSSLELLFLSACQTLAGDRWAALGMAGVAIRSGARSTIASIWNADDEASAELVTLFYQALTQKQGISKAKALRQAQIAMIKNPRYALPVYWSPYVLIGNWQ